MLRLSAWGIIALSVLHMIVLGYDAANHAASAVKGDLWTWEHWGPVAGQRPDLVLTGFAFWSTIGSFAVPLGVLGALILWMDRQGIRVPAFVGFALLAWTALSTILMPPSGFPVALLVAAALCLALTRGHRNLKD
ncbi:DUF6463 family protein [Tabrizicola sp.]|uniref:DUF6463 family protein n=1 Tax=Tabrizicola sp. TaxID=2005166 RepID=UPI003F2E5B44